MLQLSCILMRFARRNPRHCPTVHQQHPTVPLLSTTSTSAALKRLPSPLRTKVPTIFELLQLCPHCRRRQKSRCSIIIEEWQKDSSTLDRIKRNRPEQLLFKSHSLDVRLALYSSYFDSEICSKGSRGIVEGDCQRVIDNRWQGKPNTRCIVLDLMLFLTILIIFLQFLDI